MTQVLVNDYWFDFEILSLFGHDHGQSVVHQTLFKLVECGSNFCIVVTFKGGGGGGKKEQEQD